MESGERPGNNILERDSVILVRGGVFLASRIKLGQAEQGMFHAHVVKFEGGELCMGRAEGLGGEGGGLGGLRNKSDLDCHDAVHFSGDWPVEPSVSAESRGGCVGGAE